MAQTLNPGSRDAVLERRTRRVAEMTASRGPASFLWGDFVTAPGTRVPGAPGTWSPLPAGEAGLVVTADAADGVRIGGNLVDGTAVLHWRTEDGDAVAEFPDGAEGVVFSYDGVQFALQVWNPRSDWARRFADISAYEWDAAWAVPAHVRLVAPGRTVAISHHRDPHPLDVPVIAEVSFTHDGAEYVLLGTEPGPGEDGIHILFRDATNGDGTYSAGRSVDVPERREGEVVLDFNAAMLLPCAFSPAWNCPVPPAENVLPFAVLAGERNAVDAVGAPIM